MSGTDAERRVGMYTVGRYRKAETLARDREAETLAGDREAETLAGEARLFRQRSIGDRASVVADLGAALE